MEPLQPQQQEMWAAFLNKQWNDDLEIEHTPDYIMIAERLPIPLTQELITSAVTEALEFDHRFRALLLLQEIFNHSTHIDVAYPTIHTRHPSALPYIRRSAIALVAFNAADTMFHFVGLQIIKKLVRLSLQHNDDGVHRWDQLLQVLQGAFLDHNLHVLEAILNVFCNLDGSGYELEVDDNGRYGGEDDLRPRFAAFLEATLRENSLWFHAMMLYLLRQEDGFDLRPFQILPFFYRMFGHREHRTALMREAIMSSLFDCNAPNMLIIGAIGVKLCLEHGPDFIFSTAMIIRIKDIILRLYGMFWLPRARRVAEQLVTVISKRLEWLIPFNRRRLG